MQALIFTIHTRSQVPVMILRKSVIGDCKKSYPNTYQHDMQQQAMPLLHANILRLVVAFQSVLLLIHRFFSYKLSTAYCASSGVNFSPY